MSSLKRSLRSCHSEIDQMALQWGETALSKQVKEIGQPFLVLAPFQLWLLSPPHANIPDSEWNLKWQKNKTKLWPKFCFSSRCSIFWRVNKRAQSRFEIKFSLFVNHVGDDSPDDSLAATGFMAFKPVLIPCSTDCLINFLICMCWLLTIWFSVFPFHLMPK